MISKPWLARCGIKVHLADQGGLVAGRRELVGDGPEPLLHREAVIQDRHPVGVDTGEQRDPGRDAGRGCGVRLLEDHPLGAPPIEVRRLEALTAGVAAWS